MPTIRFHIRDHGLEFFTQMGVEGGHHKKAGHEADKNHIIHKFEAHNALLTVRSIASVSSPR